MKIIKTISVVQFPNELNPKRSQYFNWSCNYYLPELSPTFNLFLAFHTICYSSVPLSQMISLACAKISLMSKLLKFSQSSSFFTSFYTQPIRSYLKQANLNLLSKHCNLHLKSVTFCSKNLFAMQTN